MRTTAPLLLSLLGLLVAGPAAAQVVTAEKEYQSPRYFYAEIKFGPYAPNIDEEFSGSDSAFHHIFGDGTDLMIHGELDWEIWKGFGAICLGGEIGYYNNTTDAFTDSGGSGSPSTSTTRAASETGITLIPLSLLAVYRFDWLAERLRVPLVPFVKFGVNYTIWWIDIDGNTASYQGDDAEGGTFGWQFNGGLAVQLDFLEPSAAKNLDVELGINHTYIFFEFTHVGSVGETKLNVGDTTWSGGIAFEF